MPEQKVFEAWGTIYEENAYPFYMSCFLYPTHPASEETLQQNGLLPRAIGGRPRRIRIEILD